MIKRQILVIKNTPKTYKIWLADELLLITRKELVILHGLLNKELGRILTCSYCGQEYPQNTPALSAQALTDHILVCPTPPLREMVKLVELLNNSAIVAMDILNEETSAQERLDKLASHFLSSHADQEAIAEHDRKLLEGYVRKSWA